MDKRNNGILLETRFLIPCIMVILLLLGACNKDVDSDGYLLVTVKYKGAAVSQATVYIRKDSLYQPLVKMIKYDSVQRADGSGVVLFNNLEAGKYYIYATGSGVCGTDSVTIRKRYRENNYDIVVNTTIINTTN
ncbi:hypothetical protein G7092_06765 [Mucilaginibacter sp. HC2]|uniref:hypothetical protein n=1 Tax=Mucilaginibacter inviolabilis TaxID=2714892 RepID=UPI00140A27EF|nr:hypothetical protein [Mucilaginibacter inviolabilis]NHA03486.1 hypothetical protein [Mucilaginibacter inviolabilis]